MQNKDHPIGINLLSNSLKEFYVTNSGKEMLNNPMPDSAIQGVVLQTGANAQNGIRSAHTRITHTLLQKGSSHKIFTELSGPKFNLIFL